MKAVPHYQYDGVVDGALALYCSVLLHMINKCAGFRLKRDTLFVYLCAGHVFLRSQKMLRINSVSAVLLV